ncbi:hypothetical protein QUF72_13575 [Desulfobacterales bacterium HSG2]|nr:hypothetical protein [Desulfobacterales bacterium HSG2]
MCAEKRILDVFRLLGLETEEKRESFIKLGKLGHLADTFDFTKIIVPKPFFIEEVFEYAELERNTE